MILSFVYDSNLNIYKSTAAFSFLCTLYTQNDNNYQQMIVGTLAQWLLSLPARVPVRPWIKRATLLKLKCFQTFFCLIFKFFKTKYTRVLLF